MKVAPTSYHLNHYRVMVSRRLCRLGWTLFARDIVGLSSCVYCCCHFALRSNKAQMSSRVHCAAVMNCQNINRSLAHQIIWQIRTEFQQQSVLFMPWSWLVFRHWWLSYSTNLWNAGELKRGFVQSWNSQLLTSFSFQAVLTGKRITWQWCLVTWVIVKL